jgi:hypothetical protein
MALAQEEGSSDFNRGGALISYLICILKVFYLN